MTIALPDSMELLSRAGAAAAPARRWPRLSAPGESGEVGLHPAGPRGWSRQGPGGVVPGQQALVEQGGIPFRETGEVRAGRRDGHVVSDDLRPGPGDRGVELL